MLKAKFRNAFITKKGSKRFSFVIDPTVATPEELEAFQASQGEYYSETDNGEPLWYTPSFVADEVTLKFSAKGSVYADTSEIDKIVSFAKSQGIDLSAGLQEKLLSAMLGKSSAPVKAPEVKAEEEQD
jgi:hypothetical protein